jgi:hypothetical protein
LIEHFNKQLLVVRESLAEQLLHFAIAFALYIERFLHQLFTSNGSFRLVKLLKVFGQAFINVVQHLLAFFGEFVGEILVGVASAVFVAPVHDPEIFS